MIRTYVLAIMVMPASVLTAADNTASDVLTTTTTQPQKTWTDTRSLRANMDLPLVKYKPDAHDTLVYPKHTPAFKVHAETIKNSIHRDILAEGKQAWEAHDQPHYIFETGADIETDVTKLQQLAKLTHMPWSGYYYPTSFGGVSARYGDEEYEDFIINLADDDGKHNYGQAMSYYQQPAEFLQLLTSDTTDHNLMHYSPAEKYDLLIGDKDFTLTNYHKQLGHRFADENGAVANWMGLCHGWAVAAYAAERPVKTVEVLAADNKTKIPFHYDDIRALVSLKWAQSLRNRDTLYVGGRCNLKDDDDEIQKDAKTGKILNKECLDTNPGTWHIVVANKIARQNKAFIMDITFDHEVWNQPVVAYETLFYNPLTDEFGAAEDSIIPIDDAFRQHDPFNHLRNNPKAKKIVGVQMRVHYLNEALPRGDDPHEDVFHSLELEYDLELDADNRIVGGEWHKNSHPDFLWDVTTAAKPRNIVDSGLARTKRSEDIFSTLINEQRIHPRWHTGLVRLATLSTLSVETDGSPLDAVISALVKLSAAE
ncbi:MAG: hypothetical protein OYH77_06535 [Pseudomonadota bacterium]|nr:hypothetical protein [Pseudomonadota bacterium]